MNEQEKKKRRILERKKQKQFVKKTVTQSAVAALILCALIAVMVPLVPKLLTKRVDAALVKHDFTKAEKYAGWMGDDAIADTQMRIGYIQAEDLLAEGAYDQAKSGFLALGNYTDALVRAQECTYQKARSLADAGEYEEAIKLFLTVSGYSNALQEANLCRYRMAEKSYAEGDLFDAYQKFEALGEYSDAKERVRRIAVEATGETDAEAALARMNAYSGEEMALMDQMKDMQAILREGWLDVGYRHTVARTADGRALAVGSNDEGQTNVQGWTDIVKICAGAYHTVGLRMDGTVVAVGSNKNGECNVGKWANVVDIAAGAFDTYAVTADGRVLHTGFTANSKAEGWTNVNQISAGAYAAAALYGNGAMLSTASESALSADSGLIALDISTGYAVGILRTGRAVASFGEMDWTGAVTVSASGAGVLGIDANGRVLTHDFRGNCPYDFESLELCAVAVAAGGNHSAVLLEDGTVRVYGETDAGQGDVSEWRLF